MVREKDRESLIRVAAATTAGMLAGTAPSGSAAGLTPWAIADVARTSIAWGGFARPIADETTLVQLTNAYVNVEEELLEKSGSTPTALMEFMARMSMEQFPLQLDVMPELARAKLLFDRNRPFSAAHSPEVMKGGWFEDLYGYSLDDFLGSVFLAHGAALSNLGTYEPSWLREAADSGALGELTFEVISGVFRDHLSATVHQFKVRNRSAQSSVTDKKKKYAFNPLRDRPFITDVAATPVAPLAHSIMGKVSPSSIYYSAIRSLGEGFGRDLGHVFEDYVGDQLRILGATLTPEVGYKKGKDLIRSTDWFLELEDWLVLLECKSARPVESVRLGDENILDLLDSNLGKGIRQVNRSHSDFSLIKAQEGSLSMKPRLGLVVTLEPFFANNNPWLREHLQAADIPLAIASAAELESLVTLGAGELNAALTDAASVAAPSTAIFLNDGLKSAAGRANVLLRDAFDGYAFMKFLDREVSDVGDEPLHS